MLLLASNFDYLTTALLPGPFTANSGGTVSGSKYLASSTQYIALTPSATCATIIVNVRINVQQIPSTTAAIFEARDGGTVQCGLYIKTNGKLQFGRGSGTLIGSESTNALTFDTDTTYFDIEARITFAASGTIHCQVNGVDAIASATADTTATANDYMDNIRLGMPAGNAVNHRFIHMIVMDGTGSYNNAMIGPVAVNTHLPVGDGNQNDWTRGGVDTGANYSQCDEQTSNGDTDYIQSATLNQVDLFDMASMPAGVNTIHAVVNMFIARKDDATTRELSSVVREGGTDYVFATARAMGSTYGYFPNIYEIDPVGNPWSVTNFNNAEFGVKVTT